MWILLQVNGALVNDISRYNQKFRQGQQAATSELMRVEALINDVSSLRTSMNMSFQDISKQYGKDLQNLFQTLSNASKQFASQVEAKEYCNSSYVYSVSNHSTELTTLKQQFQTLHAKQYQSTDADDYVFQADVLKTLISIYNNFNAKPSLQQFVSLTEGTIYELKPLDYSQTVESFDSEQAQHYSQEQLYFRQFFGTPDDDVLLIVDASDKMSNATKQTVFDAARQFISQVSPFVNLKIMLAADDLRMSAGSYVNLKNNSAYFTTFLNEGQAQNFGYQLTQELLVQLIEAEIDLHQMFADFNGSKTQPVPRQFVFVISPSLQGSHSYKIDKIEFKAPVTLIRFDSSMVTFKNGQSTSYQKAQLTEFQNLTNAETVFIRSSNSQYAQNLQNQNIITKKDTICKAVVDPEYYDLGDAISKENQIDSMLYIQHAIQQALKILYPSEETVLLSNFSNLTLISNPVYVNMNNTGRKLLGFFNVMVNFSELFSETRDFIQYEEIVAQSHPVGKVVDENLIIIDSFKLQVIQQEDFLYIVDQQPVDSKLFVRTSKIFDAVLTYSDSNTIKLTSLDCSSELDPKTVLGTQYQELVICKVEQSDTDYKTQVTNTFTFYLSVNKTVLNIDGTQDPVVGLRAAVINLLNSSQYNTQLKLIANQIIREEWDISKYNVGLPVLQQMEPKPSMYCTINRNLCGFTANLYFDKPNKNPQLTFFQRLFDKHNPHRAAATFMNYTRVIPAPEHTTNYVLQRHYTSLNMETLYANSTFLIHLTCIPIPDIAGFFLDGTLITTLNQAALFINYDGVVEHGAMYWNNTQYTTQDITNTSMSSSTIMQELWSIIAYNNLTSLSDSESVTPSPLITFLTDNFKSSEIYDASLLQNEIGACAYEQFEGSLLFVLCKLSVTNYTKPEVLKEFVDELFFKNITTQNGIQENWQRPLEFKAYIRVTRNIAAFDTTAQTFKSDNTALFSDWTQDEQINVTNIPAMVIGITVPIIAFIIYYCF
ncbi:Conserved_hypothetical protein [Hexamita inflata]|uniref:Uncharacterized protein n=1 Tax=Hexamita inflata TaxID=28002 RepID=A0AA86V1E6_9EUKA|nr:Conserved hypothetical protein [Hexamita inflata]